MTRRRPRAHPRSRGENKIARRFRGQRRGSSPLTRGKQRLWRAVPVREGLIPAHAGKTARPARRSCAPRAHPRSRGENRIITGRTCVMTGSSPLTRGKLVVRVAVELPPGLIPAHAGKTSQAGLRPRPHPAHPRSRGENWGDETARTTVMGSSPLTRGKLETVVNWPRVVGLIPAHAGKTSLVRWALPSRWAHPRSRGENIMEQTADAHGAGSSPLTRGKRVGIDGDRAVLGLIPAHAGKTWRPTRRRPSDSAHPRSRGENDPRARSARSPVGSSPLTRGKHAGGGFHRERHGLIPAHAGKTPAPRVYPEWDDGSSPLTRGKLRDKAQPEQPNGLIPAHAGKT